MSFSVLPLSYCTNAHPGLTVDEVCQGLEKYTDPLQKQCKTSIAAGLWLSQPVIQEILNSSDALSQLQSCLKTNKLTCYTLNAFPYGDFHSERVKENVYLPDWTTKERLEYTVGCAHVLASLLPAGTEGSISTVPLGFKHLVDTSHGEMNPNEDLRSQRKEFVFENNTDFIDGCINNLIELAKQLDDLHDETGSVVRLAIEPEPLCVLETTAETIQFFNQLWKTAEEQDSLIIAKRHLGVCYDVCHQSVEFEDVADSISSLSEADIRINKIHITCAIQVDNPSDEAAREFLANYVEPRYLHQSFAKSNDDIHYQLDLSEALTKNPSHEFINAQQWRIHFHVPVNAESIGPLKTTRHDLIEALKAVKELEYAPHLEVETYTWNVMPGEKPVELVDGLTQEMLATNKLLNSL